MKVLILGASGKCGQWVTRLAVYRGHEVTAVSRPESPYVPVGGVVDRRGQVTDPDFVADLVRGQDVVISCVGLRRAWISPFARLLSPPDLVATVVRHTTAAMVEHQVPRLIVISAGGVGATRERTSFFVRRLIDCANVGVAYRDLAEAEEHLRSTDLDWCAVQPVTLVNGSPTGRVGPASRYGVFSTVRRSDVADWIVEQLDQPSPAGDRQVLLGRAG